jgi:protein-S-isoprenylcysteine O-methyltransferase Ste14
VTDLKDSETSRISRNSQPSIPLAGVIGLLAYLLIVPSSLFLAAGSLDWLAGWIYVLMLVFVTFASRVIALRKHPGLLRERSRFMEGDEGVARWDRLIVSFIGGIGPILVHVVAGLNYRFEWPPSFAIWLQVVGLFAVAAGYALASWAMIVNPFFSSVVRIQKDRGQVVVADGPYRWVRHPAYAGGILSTFAAPLLLGTFWALIPALLACAVLALRTRLEDNLLVAELAGYKEFSLSTKYRLVSGIW